MLRKSFISTRGNQPISESPTHVCKESDTTRVRDKFPASEKDNYIAEATATLSVKTEQLSEKAQVSTSATSSSEDKEKSHADPKGISQSEAAEGEDKVAKGIRDDTNKEPSLEVADQEPSSRNKTQTVQTVLPREKTTVHSEVKELHQGPSKGS